MEDILKKIMDTCVYYYEKNPVLVIILISCVVIILFTTSLMIGYKIKENKKRKNLYNSQNLNNIGTSENENPMDQVNQALAGSSFIKKNRSMIKSKEEELNSKKNTKNGTLKIVKDSINKSG